MLTIERLAKIDNIATRIIAGLRRGIEYLSDNYEARLVDAAHRVAEAKAARCAALVEALLAADEDYDTTIREASEKLRVEIEA